MFNLATANDVITKEAANKLSEAQLAKYR